MDTSLLLNNVFQKSKIKFRIFIFFLICLYNSLIVRVAAQTLAPEVVSSAGDQVNISAGTIEWTIGETVIDTYLGSGYIVTKGFHQPSLMVSSVHENNLQQTFSVYPNPIVDQFQIDFTSVKEGIYSIELFDASGRRVSEQSQYVSENRKTVMIIMEDKSAGIYTLKITSIQNNIFSFFKVVKE
jgi:hypothetical protein